MRGIPSEAMIMCAEDGGNGKCEIICPPEGSQIGDRVTCEKYPGEPDSILNTKKKVFERNWRKYHVTFFFRFGKKFRRIFVQPTIAFRRTKATRS